MPPRVRVTKEEIVRAATDLVRAEGMECLNARRIASALGCSTQPIFSNFGSMEELRAAVIEDAERIYGERTDAEIARGEYPPYKASGMAYIRFAAEERELFRLLYMRDRSREEIPESTGLNDRMTGMVEGNTGLGQERARLFHLEMWAFVHGIAVMSATNYLKPDTELVSRMLTDAYQGLKKRYEEET